MKNVLLTFAATALALAAPAAQGAEYYAGLGAGRWLPHNDAAIASRLDPGFTGELRAGWRVVEQAAVEVALGGFDAERTLPAQDVTETTLHSVAGGYALVAVRGFLPLGAGRWQLSASAGVGYYSVDLQAKEPPSTEVDASETDTGIHLGAAVHWAATEHVGLLLEYREVQVSPGDVDVDGAAVLLAAEYHF